MRPRSLLLGVLSVTVAFLVGCSSAPGPLGAPDQIAVWCAPGPLITYTGRGNSYTLQEQTALALGQHGACNMPPGVT